MTFVASINYPEYFSESASNPQLPFCYPEAALWEFRKWVDQNILETAFPSTSRVRKNAAQSCRHSESCPGTVAAGQTVFVFAVCRAATTINAFEDELILERDPPWNRTHLKRRNVRKMPSTLKLRLRRP